jgi:hypothetical protein
MMKRSTILAVSIASDIFAVAVFVIAFRQNEETGDLFSSPLFYVALGLFIIVPTILVFLATRSGGSSSADLMRTGMPAYATILEMWEGRPDQAGARQVSLKLQVNPANSSDSYETKLIIPVTASPYHTGMVLKVHFDPKNRKRVALDEVGNAPGTDASPATGLMAAGSPAHYQTSFSTQANVDLPGESESSQNLQNLSGKLTSYTLDSTDLSKLPPAIQNLVQAALVDADHNGIPDVMEKGGLNANNIQVMNLSGRPVTPEEMQARIARLQKLSDAGIINQETFDLLRRKLEEKANSGPNHAG